MTKTRIPPESYFDEYAQSAVTERITTAPITTRITPLLIAIEQSLVSAYAAGMLLVCSGALLGWYARGLWGPVWDNRGWAALVVFSIVGSTWIVNERNNHHE